MNKKYLILTMGLPYSGKSTWARNISREYSCPVVNPDSVRLAMHGRRFTPEAEPFVWATVKIMVNSLFLYGYSHVIVDATNITRKKRDVFKSDFYETRVKIIDTDVNTCIERANINEDEIILSVIDRMHKQWEQLQEDEIIYTDNIFS